MGIGNETGKSFWRESHAGEAGPNSSKFMYFLQVRVNMHFEAYDFISI